MLRLQDGFDVADHPRTSAELVHALVERKKLAFADRDTYVADLRIPMCRWTSC